MLDVFSLWLFVAFCPMRKSRWCLGRRCRLAHCRCLLFNRLLMGNSWIFARQNWLVEGMIDGRADENFFPQPHASIAAHTQSHKSCGKKSAEKAVFHS